MPDREQELKLIRLGSLAAVLAVAAATLALLAYPDVSVRTGHAWAVVVLVAALAMLALAAVQHRVWKLAIEVWRGTVDHDLARSTSISWGVHLLSYPVALVGLWAGIAASVAAGTASLAAALLAFGLLFLLVAQLLAGVQFLRPDGPSGTIPGHLRRLSAAVRRSRRGA